MRASSTCGALVSSLLVAACSAVFVPSAPSDASVAGDAGVDSAAPPAVDAAPIDAAPSDRDANAPSDAALVDAADGAAPLPFRVFVTNTAYDGKPGLGGLAGADDVCRQAATRLSSFDSTRRWMAYLAVNGQHPGARFGDPSGGWVRVDGRPVFGSRADVVAGRLPTNPIALSELGAPPQGTSLVWTGMSNNTPGGNTCDGWRSGSAIESGRVGNATRIDQSWQSDDNSTCNFDRHVFCFEQPAL